MLFPRNRKGITGESCYKVLGLSLYKVQWPGLYKVQCSFELRFFLKPGLYKVQWSSEFRKKYRLTAADRSRRFTTALWNFKFPYDSMPHVLGHKITNTDVTAKRRKPQEPQGNSKQFCRKELSKNIWLHALKVKRNDRRKMTVSVCSELFCSGLQRLKGN